MIQKRPFVDEGCYEVAYKHLRQWEGTNHCTPVGDAVPSDGSYRSPRTSGGEDVDNIDKSQNEWRSESNVRVSKGTSEESEAGTSGCVPHLLWANNGAIESDFNAEASLHLPFFPEIFLPGLPLKALFHSDDIYSSLLENPPWKSVSVGPDHQADIPEWGLQGSGTVDDCDGEKLMGTCVSPMPSSGASVDRCSESWGTRIECRCIDRGSVICIRQHVMEAREKLRENLGQKIFEELGFCDMGEEVAKTWSVEEEQAFHNVVLSNPASLGKNFWERLSLAFPFRAKKDLVSFYFNVYILRKRAEQNRFDPLNIDSDNDEWQRNENEMAEDDKDSVVGSLSAQEASACNHQNYGANHHAEIDDDDEIYADVVQRVATDEEDGGDVDDVSGAYIGNSTSDCGADTSFQLPSRIQDHSNGDGCGFQNDSCTSYLNM